VGGMVYGQNQIILGALFEKNEKNEKNSRFLAYFFLKKIAG